MRAKDVRCPECGGGLTSALKYPEFRFGSYDPELDPDLPPSCRYEKMTVGQACVSGHGLMLTYARGEPLKIERVEWR